MGSRSEPLEAVYTSSMSKPRVEFVNTSSNVGISWDNMTEVVVLMENEDTLGILPDDKIKLKVDKSPVKINSGFKQKLKSKKRSELWSYFLALPDNKAKCGYCSQILSVAGGSTGNLNRHMKMKHLTDALCPRKEETQSSSNIEYILSTNPSETVEVKPIHVNKFKPNRGTRASNRFKTKNRSELWNHFIKLGVTKAKCSHCAKLLTISNGSTGNLARHMRMKHHDIQVSKRSSGVAYITDSIASEEVVFGMGTESSQLHGTMVDSKSDLTEFIKLNKSVPSKKFAAKSKVSFLKYDNFDQQLIKMIVKEYYPFNIVEGAEFKKFVQMLCPTYNLPTRKSISTNLIPHIFDVTLDKVRYQVSQATSVCLAIEGWTSITSEYYLTITAHFIDNETELCSYMIGCISFNDWDTPEYIASLLKHKVEEWGLEHRIEAVVSENTSNLTAAINHAGWTHIYCFAHTTNLIVHAGLQEIKVVIEKVKAIVDFFKRSVNDLAQLISVQEQLGLPKIKLKQATGTRWNSIYDMLSRIITIKDAIISISGMFQSEMHTLSAHEWEVIQKAVEILEIFNDMTNEVSAEKIVSISKLVLYARAMVKFVRKYTNDTVLFPEIRMMIEALRDQLVAHFKDVEKNKMFLEATLLDPRFKRNAFVDDKHFMVAFSSLSEHINNVPFETPAEENNSADNQTSPISLWEDFDCEVKKAKVVHDSNTMAMIELDKYLQEPLIDRRENPLLWWKERKRLYPRCYEVMKMRLCITATSVPCDRVFTKEGQNMIDRRSRINSSKIAEILFLNHNLE